MGLRMAYELMEEISDEGIRNSIVNLARGEISDLVKLENGWAFFRAEESSYPADINEPLQRQIVRFYIMNNARGRMEDWLIAEAETFAARAREIGFDEAVKAAYIEKFNFGPAAVNYGDTWLFSRMESAGIPELKSAGTNTFFWRTAFSTPLNTVSAPVVVDVIENNVVVDRNVIVLYPLEETSADDDEIQTIEASYPYWMGDSSVTAYRTYFLTNEKFDNRFDETFSRLWMPN
jgi:hypothetical protein